MVRAARNDEGRMTSILASDLRGPASPAARERFLNAEPFHHVLIENFLSPPFLERLMSEFPAFDREKAMSELGDCRWQGGPREPAGTW